jgi:hypothetical protein
VRVHVGDGREMRMPGQTRGPAPRRRCSARVGGGDDDGSDDAAAAILLVPQCCGAIAPGRTTGQAKIRRF